MGGGGLVVAFVHPLEVRLHGISRGEEEVALHLIELGVVGVLHPHNPADSSMGNGDGAHLYSTQVGDVGGGPDERIVGTSALLILVPSPLLPPSL